MRALLLTSLILQPLAWTAPTPAGPARWAPAPGVSAAAGATAPADTTGVLRTVARAREALADLPLLWGFSGDTVAWLFVGREHAFATERRGDHDVLTPVTLPSDAPRANMAYDLDGRRVAMVVLPLGGDDDTRVRLLVHEATHTFQPHLLPHPGGTEPMEGGDLLDGPAGRRWLFLELRALARALTAAGDARRTAARDALLFRARRDSLAHPAERARLDALDLAEGIPEYTAWRLTRAEPARLAARLDSAPARDISWVRAVGYDTGPAYGFLLDALAASAWRPAYAAGNRLPDILRTVLGSTPFTTALEARARLYGGDAIRRAEEERAAAIARRTRSLRARFVENAVLRLIPGALRVTFDPNGQYPLGDAGTVMRNFRWAGAEGAELVAPEGALVSPSWQWIQVPLPASVPAPGPLSAPRTLEGPGWTLTLPAGWRFTRVGDRVEVRPPA
jgi:hypothetical protein